MKDIIHSSQRGGGNLPPSRAHELPPRLRHLGKSYAEIAWEKGHPPNPIRRLILSSLAGMALRFRPIKRITILMCAMRSGSTLLKALLANHSEVSHLPEVDFQKNVLLNKVWRAQMTALAREKYLLLKLPCSYRECSIYPILPTCSDIRRLVLFRNPPSTIRSLKKMNETKQQYLDLTLADLIHYWCAVYEQILNIVGLDQRTLYVNYDKLITHPIETTQRVFTWMGIQSAGFDTYRAPTSYEWRWNIDDGGPVIKTLRVQFREDPEDSQIKQQLDHYDSVQRIYDSLLEHERRSHESF